MKKTICTMLFLLSPCIVVADDSPDKAMCDKAILEANDTLTTYRETLKKNFEGGHITQANYDETISKFTMIESMLTDEKCMSSKGKDLAVYRCLAKNYGDVMGCMSGS